MSQQLIGHARNIVLHPQDGPSAFKAMIELVLIGTAKTYRHGAAGLETTYENVTNRILIGQETAREFGRILIEYADEAAECERVANLGAEKA